MRLSLAFLLYLLPLLSAAPAPSLSSAPPSAVAAASTPASETSDGASTIRADSVTPSSVSNSRQSTSQTPTTTHKPTAATSKHHAATKTVQATGGQIPVHSTSHTVVPGPAPSHFHPQLHHHHQSEATLVFEILGALAGVVFILSVIRCIYSYNRTPSHDRITSILHRHQLQREMEELERHPPDRRHSLVEPPPPYVAPPPSYPDDESTQLTNRGSASYGEDPRTPSSFRPNG